MKKASLQRFRKRTKSDVGPEVIVRLKKARLAAHVSLQDAGTKLRVAMSTVHAMERGVCPIGREQAEILFAFYAQSACAIAQDVAAMLGS